MFFGQPHLVLLFKKSNIRNRKRKNWIFLVKWAPSYLLYVASGLGSDKRSTLLNQQRRQVPRYKCKGSGSWMTISAIGS
jgi:hypothetical protein